MQRPKRSKLGIFSLVCVVLFILLSTVSLIVRYKRTDLSAPMAGANVIVLTTVIVFILSVILLFWLYYRKSFTAVNSAVAELRAQGKVAFICAGEGGLPAYMLMTINGTALTVLKYHKGALTIHNRYPLESISPMVDKVEGQKGLLHDGINLQDDPLHPSKYFILPFPAKIVAFYMRGQLLDDVVHQLKR